MSTSADDLRTRVESSFGELSPTGRRVAMALLDVHHRIGFHSATDIARIAGTSDATVIRTVQRLGYRGIIELKAAVADELEPVTPTQRLDASIAASEAHASDPVTELLDNQFRALARLHQSDVRAATAQAITAFGEANRVLVNAHGVSAGIAAHAAAQLARIGIDARTFGSAAGITGDDLLGVRPTDALLVISSGTQQRWHDAMYERCTDLGTRIVLITDTHPAPNNDAIVLRVGRGDHTGTATHVATIAAIETILLGLATRDRGQTTSTLDELNRHRRRLTR